MSRKNYKSVRKNFDSTHEEICVNCGSKKNLERHHVVPLHMGGNNIQDNIVFLCHACHKLAHESRSTWNSNAGNCGGRKRKYLLENIEDALYDYTHCKIGKKEFMKRIGSHDPRAWGVHGNKCMQEFCKKNNIMFFRNKLDILNAQNNNGASTGKLIGQIMYSDGSEEFFYAK